MHHATKLPTVTLPSDIVAYDPERDYGAIDSEEDEESDEDEEWGDEDENEDEEYDDE